MLHSPLVQLGRHRAEWLAEQLGDSQRELLRTRSELEDASTQLAATQKAAAEEQARLTVQLGLSQAELLAARRELQEARETINALQARPIAAPTATQAQEQSAGGAGGDKSAAAACAALALASRRPPLAGFSDLAGWVCPSISY